MRSSMVVAATLLAALLGVAAAAEQGAGGRASLGARALTDRLAATDSRSGTLRIDAEQGMLLASPDRIVLNAAGSQQLLRGNGDVALEGAEVRVQASSRIVLSAPVLVTP